MVVMILEAAEEQPMANTIAVVLNAVEVAPNSIYGS